METENLEYGSEKMTVPLETIYMAGTCQMEKSLRNFLKKTKLMDKELNTVVEELKDKHT